ncbi:mechanosensitive ion channel family protein [Desulforhopalus sp. IMCC35007]|uniref:mechanosensitive ion channel family protein n=1 Tax=Desulforhopalus sp. IMCC35007 TaxID=2569543 RepID=UPI0010AEC26A|nr:mechanosensitive ion channel family protein [Desulforhopalus sp. IMCC35007]TKB08439.1 mechanosensitive ion channel family protein [Desulforhopalus sp. IMCC35007]
MGKDVQRRRCGYGTVSVSFLLVVSVYSRVGAGVKEDSAGSFEQSVISFLRPVIEIFAGNSWLQGVAAIAATFTVASVVTWILFKVVKKFTSRTKIDFDDHITALARPPVYYTFLVSGFTYGLSLMPLSAVVHQIGVRSIQSLGVVVWVLFFSRLSSLLLNRLALLSHKFAFIERRTVTLFENVAKVVIFGVGLYLIFVIWKIDMTAWLASAGIVGIAVGFAAKDTLSNLFSGVFILADAPYKVGDFIVMDNGSRGQVTNIGLRSTRILTRDDVEVTIPNSIMGNSTIINQSGGPSEKMRVRLTVGVAYGSDIDLVKDLMLSIAQNEPQVCSTPEPSLRFRVFGASSLDFELRCWVSHPRYCSRVIDALNSKIYKEFERLQIEIPYAKQDLYIKGLPEGFSGLNSVGGGVISDQK